jgi:apolipoprotein N-acyltransferase
MITPNGEIAYKYVKLNLLIGPEIEHTIRGERKIYSIDTPYGRLASVICLDMDYPSFMRLAANQGVDIMLSGAIDGTAGTNGNPLHSIMASYRAIEDGFSLGRAGYYGENVIVDYQGRTISMSNHYTAVDRSVTAQIPIKGVTTLYGKLGDFFPWVCIVVIVFLTLYSIILRSQRKNSLKNNAKEQDTPTVS